MRNGVYAVVSADRNNHVIDLLFIGMVMPGLNGRELFEKLNGKQSGLRRCP